MFIRHVSWQQRVSRSAGACYVFVLCAGGGTNDGEPHCHCPRPRRVGSSALGQRAAAENVTGSITVRSGPAVADLTVMWCVGRQQDDRAGFLAATEATIEPMIATATVVLSSTGAQPNSSGMRLLYNSRRLGADNASNVASRTGPCQL